MGRSGDRETSRAERKKNEKEIEECERRWGYKSREEERGGLRGQVEREIYQ